MLRAMLQQIVERLATRLRRLRERTPGAPHAPLPLQ